MVGNTNVGGTKLFAAIGVTYPAGYTATCTNGTTTLKAETTTGQWVFAIPEAGTWTVSATQGTNTNSQSVSISAEGQFEAVELSGGLWLYDSGNKFEGTTGGWVNRGKLVNTSFFVDVNFALNSDSLTLSSTQTGASGSASTAKKIPINNKSKLCADIVLTGTTPNEALICLTSATSYIYDNAASAVAYGVKQVPFTGVVEVDISNVSGEYYVAIGAHANNETGISLKVNKIWIE